MVVKKIVINNFAMINKLELLLDKNMEVIIGAQASGKSTLAKLIYFCRKVKDYLLEYLIEPKNFSEVHSNEYYTYFLKFIRKQFMGCFGTTKHMKYFTVDFYYDWDEKNALNSNGKKMSLTLDKEGYVKVHFSKAFAREIQNLIDESARLFWNFPETNVSSISNLLNDLKNRQVVRGHFTSIIADLFLDSDEILYIPAGRSILATLSEQLNKLDVSAVDLPLQEFINLIGNTKIRFGSKMPEIVSNYTKTIDGQIKNADVVLAYCLIKEILRGDYICDPDGEKLYYSQHEYVKLIYASSGQQEVIWILLVIFIRILEQKRAFIVLEEPEAHLFPMAQKKVVELISLLINSTGSSVFITTHSPYILTSVNLSVYSAKIESSVPGNTEPVVHKMLRISPERMDAFMIKNEEAFSFVPIKDCEEQLIDAVQIDEVSEIINRETEKIMNLEIQYDM